MVALKADDGMGEGIGLEGFAGGGRDAIRGRQQGVYTPLLDSYPYLGGGIIRDGVFYSDAIAILGIRVQDISLKQFVWTE